MFQNLSDKLASAFKKFKNKGKLTEADVKAGMREIKLALLEADVNFRVVKQFVKSVEERAVGQDVMNSLTPGQTVIKIVNEELVKLMGETPVRLPLHSGLNVLMMVGLNGAGKTTMSAKLGGELKKYRRPLLVAADVYRPAAIEQLQINGGKVGVPVFTMGDKHNPVDIVKAAIEHATKNGNDLVIVDTAGRQHIDEALMEELVAIKAAVKIDQTILVVDAMTGQDAVNAANSFNERIGIDGVILTKLDSDTRGGAALSIRSVTGKPILYSGVGEKLTDIEQFYPDRMASRILGMGDVMSLIEKAEAAYTDEQADKLAKKFKKAEFDFNDMLEQFDQMKKMGSLQDIMGMIPGMGSKMKNVEIDDKAMNKPKAIILSMTPKERANPKCINPSRKRRIAAGAGVEVSDVNRLLNQFEQSKKMMKQMSGMMSGKGGRRGGFKFPF
jgi:signal recognition particle subunit SRP54